MADHRVGGAVGVAGDGLRDVNHVRRAGGRGVDGLLPAVDQQPVAAAGEGSVAGPLADQDEFRGRGQRRAGVRAETAAEVEIAAARSEEHTSELQSLAYL